jgi:hypothetical protein
LIILLLTYIVVMDMVIVIKVKLLVFYIQLLQFYNSTYIKVKLDSMDSATCRNSYSRSDLAS